MPDVLTGFTWDRSASRYRSSATGRYVARNEIVGLLGTHISSGEGRIESLTRGIYEGTIAPSAYAEQMRTQLRRLHLQNAALGAGGWDRLRPADYGRIGQRLREDYGRINRLINDVRDGNATLPQALNRANGYVGNSRISFWETERNAQSIPEPGKVIIERRVLGAQKNCRDCLNYYAAGWQPFGVLPVPGLSCACGTNCKCRMERRQVATSEVGQWVRSSSGERQYSPARTSAADAPVAKKRASKSKLTPEEKQAQAAAKAEEKRIAKAAKDAEKAAAKALEKARKDEEKAAARAAAKAAKAEAAAIAKAEKAAAKAEAARIAKAEKEAAKLAAKATKTVKAVKPQPAAVVAPPPQPPVPTPVVPPVKPPPTPPAPVAAPTPAPVAPPPPVVSAPATVLDSPAAVRAEFKRVWADAQKASALESEAYGKVSAELKPLQDKLKSATRSLLKASTPEAEKIANDKRNEIQAQIQSVLDRREVHVSNMIRLEKERDESIRKLVRVSEPSSNTLTMELGDKMVVAQKWDSAINEFNQMVSKNVMDGRKIPAYLLPSGDRAYANSSGGGQIFIAMDSDAPVIIHELGHVLEYDPKVYEKSKAFFSMRTAGDIPEKLNDIVGKKIYDDTEIAKRDKWVEPYTGKVYWGSTTEVVSMGIEWMYKEPARFAAKDPEFFDFMFNLLRGR